MEYSNLFKGLLFLLMAIKTTLNCRLDPKALQRIDGRRLLRLQDLRKEVLTLFVVILKGTCNFWHESATQRKSGTPRSGPRPDL